MRGNGGFVLGMVLVFSFVMSIAAFAVMAMALSRASTSVQSRSRIIARYAAEGGMVWAMQRLWVNPDFCPNAVPVTVGVHSVAVTVSNCGSPTLKRIDASVTY